MVQPNRPKPPGVQIAAQTPQEAAAAPFWTKPLETLNASEWEALCDGCGRCCLVKLEDDDTGRIYFTDIACRLLDCGSCRCGDYPRRRAIVPDCMKLDLATLDDIPWLPPTCAYRLRRTGRDLPEWHPLISGDPDSVHRAGVSVRGRVGAMEGDVEDDDLLAHVVTWPGRWPARAKRANNPKKEKIP